MARTLRDARLETRTARAALKPSGKPYWRAIEQGLHLGYRKGVTSGRWVMRQYVGGQSYTVETIATADDTIDADGDIFLSFAQAQAAARKRFVEGKRVTAGLASQQAGPYTVADAMSEYLSWLEQNRKSARISRWSNDAFILPDLGAIPCDKLTTDILARWLHKQTQEPARLRTPPGEPQRYREPANDEDGIRRRRGTANRRWHILRAALYRAWRAKKIASDDAWRSLAPFRETGAARVRYLQVDEARRLINAADPDFRRLVQAALMTGCRYAELAALVAGDFNPDSNTLHIRISKSGKNRHVVLAQEGADFFRQLAMGRSSKDRLLPKADGSRWGKSHQDRPMLMACTHAKIEPPANFHCLRHTYASLMIMNGAPLMVVGRNLGHADTRMVEKHYGHLAASYVADAIRAAAPKFGIGVEWNVVSVGAANR
jgi:integrase